MKAFDLNLGSRLAVLFASASSIGLHGFRSLHIIHRVASIYETLAKTKGTKNVTEAEVEQAIKQDPDLMAEESTHPFLDLLIKYLPYLISILASLFNFPTPPAS